MSNGYITLNGTQLRPTAIDVQDERLEEEARMANGVLRSWFIAYKQTWTLSWENMPETSLSTIRNLYRLTSAMTLIDVTAASFTVKTSSFNHTLSATSQSRAGVYYYNVTLVLVEI